MDFKILRIESDTQKIGLSHRAVGKEDEPVIDTKNYSTEAKGGMTSLGELMNLKRGGEEDIRADQGEQPRLSKKERKALQAQERAEQERMAAERAATEAEQQQNTETTSAGAEQTAVNNTSGAQPEEASNDEANSADSPEIGGVFENTDQAAAAQTTGTADESPTSETSLDVGETASAASDSAQTENSSPEAAASSAETVENSNSENAETSKDSEEKTANG
jgi:colicin import membrane protein